MTTAAEQLATLRAMTRDLPDRRDTREQAAIDADMAAEQAAEDKAWMRENPTDGDSDWAARRWAS
jgi:hypothetical protein